MAITSALVRQVLAESGFDELPSEDRGAELGATFRHRELPPPWSITAWVDAGEAVPHVDVLLRFGEQQVGNVHRVSSDAALVASLPAILSSLTALVGSQALMCPRCGDGWVTVMEPGGAQVPFLACTNSCEYGAVLPEVQAIVIY